MFLASLSNSDANKSVAKFSATINTDVVHPTITSSFGTCHCRLGHVHPNHTLPLIQNKLPKLIQLIQSKQ